MRIEIDDLSHPRVAELVQQHLDDMYATSPAESVHALDLDKFRQSDITFWTAWKQQDFLGCGALKPALKGTTGALHFFVAPIQKVVDIQSLTHLELKRANRSETRILRCYGCIKMIPIVNL